MTWYPVQNEKFLPDRGHVMVTITVVDADGFTHHHPQIHTRTDVFARVLGALSSTTTSVTRPGMAQMLHRNEASDPSGRGKS